MLWVYSDKCIGFSKIGWRMGDLIGGFSISQENWEGEKKSIPKQERLGWGWKGIY